MESALESPTTFTVTSYAEDPDGNVVEIVDTWMWKPEDERSQPLYRLGVLPADVRTAYEAAADRAVLYVDPKTERVSPVPEPGFVEMTAEEKAYTLDGFFWFARANSHATAMPDREADPFAYWAAHTHKLHPDYKSPSKAKIKAYRAALETHDGTA